MNNKLIILLILKSIFPHYRIQCLILFLYMPLKYLPIFHIWQVQLHHNEYCLVLLVNNLILPSYHPKFLYNFNSIGFI
jgi:hypothetical protein